MKKIYFLGVLAIVILASCTPDTMEIRQLREETAQSPNVSLPGVDMTKTHITFNPREVEQLEIYRDPATLLLEDEVSFSFKPDYAGRKLGAGESFETEIQVEVSPYERSLTADQITVEKGTLTTNDRSEEFKVTLKKDAFKDALIKTSYVLILRATVKNKIPADLSVNDKNAVYRIKIDFTEESFPKGDNIDVISYTTETPMSSSAFALSSNYAATHLDKLVDGSNTTGNWWVDTSRTDIYLKATFTQPTLVKGFIITQREDSKRIGGVTVVASNGKKEYVQGVYAPQESYRPYSLVIEFKEPINVHYIQLQDFKRQSNVYINLHEIRFF